LIFLREKGKPCDAVLAQDGAGYPQPLIAVYDRPAADYALKRLRADNHIGNSPLRLLRQSLRTATLEISDLESLDVDTTADRDTLERLLHSQRMETQRTQKAGQ
jgi:molybdopterin-guanine dinucleotide biosynthesis protein A